MKEPNGKALSSSGPHWAVRGLRTTGVSHGRTAPVHRAPLPPIPRGDELAPKSLSRRLLRQGRCRAARAVCSAPAGQSTPSTSNVCGEKKGYLCLIQKENAPFGASALARVSPKRSASRSTGLLTADLDASKCDRRIQPQMPRHRRRGAPPTLTKSRAGSSAWLLNAKNRQMHALITGRP